MHFSLRRVNAIFSKDWLELRKNRGLLFSLLALPLVVSIVPVGIVWAYVRDPADAGLRALAQYYDATVTRENSARFLIEHVLTDWFMLFLIMPVFVPILISAQAIAGEKERRTLEPLLASPVTRLELVMGKSLASLLPAFAITVFAFAILCVGVDVVAWPLVHKPLLPNTMWLYGVLLIAPLFSFFGNGIAVLLSARVGDARLAQQLAGLFVLPLVGLASAQFGGFLKAGGAYYAILAGIVLVLDAVLLFAATRVFDRERLMSRWS